MALGQEEEAFQALQDLCPVFVFISVKSRITVLAIWGSRVIPAVLMHKNVRVSDDQF